MSSDTINQTERARFLKDLELVAAPASDNADARAILFRAIFDVGLREVGAEGRMPAHPPTGHEAPIRALQHLYSQSDVHRRGAGDRGQLSEVVDATLRTIDSADDRESVVFFVDRSRWLRRSDPIAPPPGLRPALERSIKSAEAGDANLVDTARAVLERPGLYDYEVATACERLIRCAVTRGDADVTRDVSRAVLDGLNKIRIFPHRMRALEECVRAASSIRDPQLVTDCIPALIDPLPNPQISGVAELASAVRAALLALREIDDHARIRAVIEKAEQVQTDDHTAAPLYAVAGGGALYVDDVDRARELFARAQRDGFAAVSGFDRLATAKAILNAIANAPLSVRAAECRALLSELSSLHDSFKTKQPFPTHQLIVAEEIVDVMLTP